MERLSGLRTRKLGGCGPGIGGSQRVLLSLGESLSVGKVARSRIGFRLGDKALVVREFRLERLIGAVIDLVHRVGTAGRADQQKDRAADQRCCEGAKSEHGSFSNFGYRRGVLALVREAADHAHHQHEAGDDRQQP